MVLHERWFTTSRVGFTYIGTVVGAGFASWAGNYAIFYGQRFQKRWAILLVTVLFSWLGIRMMVIGGRLKARSYEEFNNYLFGAGAGRWMNWFVGVILFGVTTAMMSGTGALFKEQLGLSFHFGVIVTSMIAFLVIIKGMEGILNVNALVVPCMFAFTLVVGIQGLSGSGLGEFLVMEPMEGTRNWIISAITWDVAFNLAMAQSVLIPLGGEIQDEKTLRLGGILGGVGLGVMLLASNFALSLKIPEIFHLEIPIALVISTLGEGMKYFFFGSDVGGNIHHSDRQCLRVGRQSGKCDPGSDPYADGPDLYPGVCLLPDRISGVYRIYLPHLGYCGLLMLLVSGCSQISGQTGMRRCHKQGFSEQG